MNLLAAIDFSDSSKIVVEKLKSFSAAFSAKVWLLHVADPDPDFVGYDIDTKTMRDVVAKRYHKEHKRLQKIGEELRNEGIDCTAILIQGPTVETILEQISKLSIDLVVLGSHGKGLLKRMLIGSISEEVLHKSQTPVLIIPTHHLNS
ncbi:MAG: universal stress protein [Gammaproteobacteria bacterium]